MVRKVSGILKVRSENKEQKTLRKTQWSTVPSINRSSKYNFATINITEKKKISKHLSYVQKTLQKMANSSRMISEN